MESKMSILIIDDEVQIRKLLEITLNSNDYHTLSAATAREGITMAVVHPPDLIVLDLGLPDEDGQVVLQKLREWYLGAIIILSVRSSEEDIVKALDNGANDYLTKPFRTGELLARIRTALRQTQNIAQIQKLEFDNLVIDLTSRIVTLNNEPIKLTATEYSLLTLLAKNDGKVLTHSYILKNIWGPGYTLQSQYLRVFVGQLRKKIEPNSNVPKFILTESGIGYRFCTKMDE
ncbi:response regulator [Flavobacterium sp. UBA6031]|uniref:response regulator n=1 Tax=Flavobacterium sp. UBA6031 TaxID=1946551 RepID=UPI0025BFE692|nr:response regulator transcription factor [Flavobacterium sp. UBA6031]